MHQTGLVGAVLNLTSLGVLDRGGDVHGDGTDLRVRHQAARTEDLTELTDHAHGVGGRDADVEVEVAGLDLLGEVVETDDFGASGAGGLGLVALGEHGHAHRLAGTGGQHDRTTDDLVRLACIDAEVHSDIDRLVELGGGALLDQTQGVGDRIGLVAVNLGAQRLNSLGQLRHDYRPSTVMPMLRAEPAMVRTAASISEAVRSGILVLAISST